MSSSPRSPSSSSGSASGASSSPMATPMTSAAQSQSVLPSPSDSGGGGGSSNSGASMLTSGTNYFFGFLVAFIAFLFIFLALGFLARRRRLRLLHDFLTYGPPDDDYSPQTEPRLYEPKFVDAPAPPLWVDIMPLSTSLVRRDVLQSKEALPLPATSSTPPAPPGTTLRSFLHFPRKAKADAGSTGPVLVKVPEALDIAVLINMPQPSGSATRDLDEQEGPPEYLIGTLHLPWKDDVLGVELPTS